MMKIVLGFASYNFAIIFLINAPSKYNFNSQLALYKTKINLKRAELVLFLERRLVF